MELAGKFDITKLIGTPGITNLEDKFFVFDNLKEIPFVDEPIRCEHLTIGICTKGKMRCSVNQKDMVVNAGQAFIVVQGQLLENIWLSEDTELFGFIIDYSFVYEIVKDVQNLSALFLLARNHPVFPLMLRELKAAQEYVEIVKRKLNGPHFKYLTDVVRLLMLTLIYDMGSAFYRVLEDNDAMMHNTKSERVFVHFIQLVEHYHREERRVSWYAEKIGITPKYLSEIISSVSKRSPNEWIDKYVTTEIRNQLRKTDKKISEIAEELHFQNQSFMGKYFRENVGVSPTEYRRGIDKREK